MRWLNKLNKRVNPSIEFNYEYSWEVPSPKDISAFFKNLDQIMPARSILYLEGNPSKISIKTILKKMECDPHV